MRVKNMEQAHGGNLKEAAEKFNISESEIIDFSANINFVGPPPDIYSKIRKEIEAITRYPEPDSTSLKKLLAEKYGGKADNYVLGNGAVELIYILTRILDLNKGLVLAPTFSEYEKALKAEEIEVNYHYISTDHSFKLNINRLKKDLTGDIDIFFLCNPNNPTGKFITRDKIKELLLHNKKKDIFTVIDEAFVDFLEQKITSLSFLKDFDKLFILRSLTKFYAVPGLRLGYGIANKEIIKKINKAKDPWNVNSLAQKAGELILEQKRYDKLTKKAIYREKIFLYQELKKFKNLRVYYPNANYIFIDLTDSNYSGSELYNQLAERSILIRNCSNYKGLDDNFIRVAVKSREENKILLKALKSFL